MRNKDDMTDLDLTDLDNYPSGRIKDDPLTGTAINNAIFHDLYVTLQKWAIDSGIVVNHEEDKEGSYQLEEAVTYAVGAGSVSHFTDESMSNGWTGDIFVQKIHGGRSLHIWGEVDSKNATAGGIINPLLFADCYYIDFLSMETNDSGQTPELKRGTINPSGLAISYETQAINDRTIRFNFTVANDYS